MRFFSICVATCVVILIYSLNPSYALDVTLAWDANTEPDLAGYVIYYGTEPSDAYDGVGAANGDSPIDMPLDQDEDPDPSVVQFTVYDLPEGTHFFVVTAYNTEGFESGYSNEVSTASDELSAPARQVSTGGTGGGGGGGCFIATAACEPNAPTKLTHLSLILVSLSLGVAAIVKKFCR